MKITSRSLQETEAAAIKFLNNLTPSPAGDGVATVVGLVGDLGSGKTAFTQATARQLGVVVPVTSPTFVIEKIYNLDNQKFNKLIHIDAYRLNKPEELLALDWGEMVADPKNLILVEWAERVAKILPASTSRIDFKFIDENTREIKW